MGLDIYVCRPIPREEKVIGSDEYMLSDFPELEIFSHLAFEQEVEFHEIDEDLKKMGYNPEDLQWRGTEYSDSVIVEFSDNEGNRIVITDPTISKRSERFIKVEEVGYQRKGANKKFYEDGMWDSPAVLKMDTLKDHWEKYFSHQTPDSAGGWGSGVEYKLEDEEMKARFKENIIDKFIEGETFVLYC